MPTTYKQLGAAAGNGTIGTAAQLYAASATAGTATIISSIVICNTSSSSATYTIAINTASATYATGRYVVFQATIAGNDTVGLTFGATLANDCRSISERRESSSVPMALMDVPTSCRFSARLRAVTVISSSAPESAEFSAARAVVLKPLIATTLAAARSTMDFSIVTTPSSKTFAKVPWALRRFTTQVTSPLNDQRDDNPLVVV